MSVLDKLEVIDGGERQAGYDPVWTRRRKLAAALVEQIEPIDALAAGETYRKAVARRRQDLETDEVVATTEHRTVPAWWRVDDAGQVHFALR